MRPLLLLLPHPCLSRYSIIACHCPLSPRLTCTSALLNAACVAIFGGAHIHTHTCFSHLFFFFLRVTCKSVYFFFFCRSHLAQSKAEHPSAQPRHSSTVGDVHTWLKAVTRNERSCVAICTCGAVARRSPRLFSCCAALAPPPSPHRHPIHSHAPLSRQRHSTAPTLHEYLLCTQRSAASAPRRSSALRRTHPRHLRPQRSVLVGRRVAVRCAVGHGRRRVGAKHRRRSGGRTHQLLSHEMSRQGAWRRVM